MTESQHDIMMTPRRSKIIVPTVFPMLLLLAFVVSIFAYCQAADKSLLARGVSDLDAVL